MHCGNAVFVENFLKWMFQEKARSSGWVKVSVGKGYSGIL